MLKLALSLSRMAKMSGWILVFHQLWRSTEHQLRLSTEHHERASIDAPGWKSVNLSQFTHPQKGEVHLCQPSSILDPNYTLVGTTIRYFYCGVLKPC